ncbi:MAG: hypothetical protein Q8P59_05745 [Dehalococcoidia bacterium]|nr:hypothetical protein [Dehalococcoidia bacterium]
MSKEFTDQIDHFIQQLKDGKKGAGDPKEQGSVTPTEPEGGVVQQVLNSMQKGAEDMAKDMAKDKKDDEWIVEVVKVMKKLKLDITMEEIVEMVTAKVPSLELTPHIVALINKALADFDAINKDKPVIESKVSPPAEFILKVKELANLAVFEEKVEAPPNILLSWENDAYVAVQAFDPPPEEPGAAAQKAVTVANGVEEVFALAVKLTSFVIHTAKEFSGGLHVSPIAIHSGPVPPEVMEALKALGAPVDVIGSKDDEPAPSEIKAGGKPVKYEKAWPSETKITWTPEEQKDLAAVVMEAGADLDNLTMDSLPIDHYTIAGKPPKLQYKKAKGVLMAFGQSWAGDANQKLAIWALHHPEKAKTVTVHFSNTDAVSMDLLSVVKGMLKK